MKYIEPQLVRRILHGYSLPLYGRHGLPHWARVLETGMKLVKETGAIPRVVALFSVFHDSRRENEGIDPKHGHRAAELVASFRRRHIDLTGEEFDLLRYACDFHTAGLTEADITVQTCWDADRLDLWRVGIEPSAEFLCTSAALNDNLQRWARERSLSNYAPRFVKEQWLKGGGV